MRRWRYQDLIGEFQRMIGLDIQNRFYNNIVIQT